MPAAKCRTGKIRATQRIQAGVLLPRGMKIPERNSSGRMLAFTIAAGGVGVGDQRR